MLHIIVGDEAAKNLKAAFELDENLQGEILVLKDTLGIGDLLSTPEISHDSIRTSWWKTIVPHFDEEVSDESRLLAFIDNSLVPITVQSSCIREQKEKRSLSCNHLL